MKEVKDSNRMIYLDLLRILAAFGVVLLHSAAQFWYSLDVRSGEWLVANAYDAIARSSVPLFVMISGALFLNPAYKVDIKRLYTHNILRLAVIYVVWSCMYGLFDCLMWYDLGQIGLKVYLLEMLGGRYHLWFLPMLIGLYVLLPLLKTWLEHAQKAEIRYFLAMFLILQIAGETIRALTVTDEIHKVLDLVKVDLICSYCGYFVWGYYLVYVGIGAGLRKFFGRGLVPAFLLNVVISYVLSRRAGEPMGYIYDSYGLFTFITTTAIFLWFAGRKTECSDKSRRIIHEISAGTFGVYLAHIGLMELTVQYGLHSMLLPNIIGIPLYAAACFLVCLLLSMILRRIPFVGRYLC